MSQWKAKLCIRVFKEGIPGNWVFKNQHVFLVWASAKKASEIYHRWQKKGKEDWSLIPSYWGNSHADTAPAAMASVEGCIKPSSQESTTFKCNSSSWHRPNNAYILITESTAPCIPGIVISSEMELKDLQILCTLSYYTCANFNMKRILCISYPVKSFSGADSVHYVYPVGFSIPVAIPARGNWRSRFKISLFSKVVAFQ